MHDVIMIFTYINIKCNRTAVLAMWLLTLTEYSLIKASFDN